MAFQPITRSRHVTKDSGGRETIVPRPSQTQWSLANWRGSALILLLLALGSGVRPGSANAALGGCISDPIVYFGNQKLHITVAINALPSQIAAVVYDVHLPVNTDAKKVRYVKSELLQVERVNLFFDQPSGQIVTITTVTAADSSVFGVTVDDALGSQDSTASGTSGQQLANQLSYTLHGDGD